MDVPAGAGAWQPGRAGLCLACRAGPGPETVMMEECRSGSSGMIPVKFSAFVMISGWGVYL
ncbi:hypothetical protein LHGZ1_2992 [Laribacter hongkongensis]|uniref:Uncharacterized protein n=1 Tax=Laribacter hongkongensis TaxID=168471 RepID=A0A248LNR1_9NEIS|nr:hypothetical protein LHGZ1_2992 [Laribacter hongkongensis]